MVKRTRIKIDHENNACAWWDAMHALAVKDVPSLLRPLTLQGEITVSADDAIAFRTWAATLPGWSDGPEYAKHPFTFDDA